MGSAVAPSQDGSGDVVREAELQIGLSAGAFSLGTQEENHQDRRASSTQPRAPLGSCGCSPAAPGASHRFQPTKQTWMACLQIPPLEIKLPIWQAFGPL